MKQVTQNKSQSVSLNPISAFVVAFSATVMTFSAGQLMKGDIDSANNTLAALTAFNLALLLLVSANVTR